MLDKDALILNSNMSGQKTALIAGVTGIAGLNLARRLLQIGGWKVYGISRRPSVFLPDGLHHVQCDLQDGTKCKNVIGSLNDVTQAFYTCWVSTLDNERDSDINKKMLENFLDCVQTKVKHVVLLTGAKHYLGTFGDFKEHGPIPFKESCPRLPGVNFYYTQEDVLFARAKDYGFTWSIPRPMTIIGFAPNTLMNLATGIAIYAIICKHLKLPFTFFGTAYQHTCINELSDAEQLADHMIWEVTEPKAANQAFNVTNGDVFRWKEMWAIIGNYFHLGPGAYSGEPFMMSQFMSDKGEAWKEIVAQYNLVATDLDSICAWWFVNVYAMAQETYLMSMNKSRDMGFLNYQNTEKSFVKTFDYLKQARVIPAQMQQKL